MRFFERDFRKAAEVMAVHYTVIQYVPDPIRGERLNVGVATYCDGHVRTKFLQNWQRVKDICGKSAPNREQFESIFQDIQQTSLVEMLSTWHNSIQFSEPGTYLGSMDEALDVASRRFLVDLAILSKEGR
jgi:hypothetical protein